MDHTGVGDLGILQQQAADLEEAGEIGQPGIADLRAGKEQSPQAGMGFEMDHAGIREAAVAGVQNSSFLASARCTRPLPVMGVSAMFKIRNAASPFRWTRPSSLTLVPARSKYSRPVRFSRPASPASAMAVLERERLFRPRQPSERREDVVAELLVRTEVNADHVGLVVEVHPGPQRFERGGNRFVRRWDLFLWGVGADEEQGTGDQKGVQRIAHGVLLERGSGIGRQRPEANAP